LTILKYPQHKMRIAIYNLQRTYLLLRDDFRIGLVISPRVAVLAWGEANTAVNIITYICTF
jgi:hypothetical protein